MEFLQSRLKTTDGKVKLSDLMDPDLLPNFSLVSRLLFDAEGCMEASDLLEAVSRVSSLDLEDKLRFLFKVYDVDQDGEISHEDLFSTLKIMVEDDLTDLQLMQLVDRTLRDGKMDFDRFKQTVAKLHIDHQLTLDI